MTPRRHLLASESGNALISALLIMGMLAMFGMALLATVDTQQRESGRERQRESAFQMGEAVLNAQIYRLSSRWPASSTGSVTDSVGLPYPLACTPASTSTDCPNDTALKASITGPDYNTGVDWTTQVRDNSAAEPNFYSDSLLSSPLTYDANNDGYLWVRATAVVRGKRRTLVALVKAEKTALTFPHHTLLAGWFTTSNSGNKVIIDNSGGYPPSEIYVRCSFPTGTAPANNCADYQSGKGQISPERVYSDPSMPNAVTPEALDSLRSAAVADGNYYTGCPPNLQGNVPGEIVFIEDAGSSCIFNGNNDYNTLAKPGMVIVGKGTLTINGDATFYGVIYHANLADSNGGLVVLGGNVSINGSIVVDGRGGIVAGSSKVNLVWNPNVFNNINAFGTAGIVQNTFREITPSATATPTP
jgi:Tfp pilus assembly protein PilX